MEWLGQGGRGMARGDYDGRGWMVEAAAGSREEMGPSGDGRDAGARHAEASVWRFDCTVRRFVTAVRRA